MILVLGGTVEGRHLAGALAERERPALLSLAGRTRDPVSVGPVRSGGFGGPEGLARFLVDEGISAVIDATHPFAATMTRNAAQACRGTGVPLVRLVRPSWADHRLAGGWSWVDTHDEAASLAARRGVPVMLTVGRQHALDYATGLGRHTVLVRVAEPPEGEVPGNWTLVCSRGPFTIAGECQIMGRHRIGVLVTKDAGGASTEAKLLAADELGVQVVVVRRPPTPAGLQQVSSVDEALAWVLAQPRWPGETTTTDPVVAPVGHDS